MRRNFRTGKQTDIGLLPILAHGRFLALLHKASFG